MKYSPGTFSTTPNKEYLRGKPSPMQTTFFWLCDHADEHGICYPKRKTLANEAGCDVKTVDKYLKQLEDEGFITKTNRNKPNSKEKTSNLYQVMIKEGNTDVGCTKNGGTGTPENGAETIPIINQTNITKVSEPVVQQENIITVGQLPVNRGKTYILRVLSIYKDLFRNKYGFEPTLDIARYGKKIKELCMSKTELQVSALLIVFFDWHGIDGSSAMEQQKLVGATHNLGWFFSSVQTYEAYIRNVMNIKFDDEETVRAFVGKTMTSL